MTKKEMKVLAEGLRRLSADIAEIADALEGKTAVPAKEEPVPAPAPIPEAPAKTWTFEEVRGLLADKARSGFRAEVKALLTAHGADRLSDIKDPAELSAIAKEAEVIGNG